MSQEKSRNFRPVEELGPMTNLSLRPQPVVRSRPVKQVYNIEAIVAPRSRHTSQAPQAMAQKSSMFFRAKDGDLDKDPFLQRLARLN